MAATDTFVPMEGEPGVRTVMSPIHLAGRPKAPPRRAPELGEHTDEILRAVGYDSAAIESLRRQGVIA